MAQLVMIFERKGRYFVDASSQTVDGFWIADNRTQMVAAHDLEGLETAVSIALDRSETSVPAPPSPAGLTSSLLAAAQVRSWNTFAKLAKCVELHLDAGQLTLTPHRNLGGKTGFEPMVDRRLTFHATAENQLSCLVLQALAAAE